MMRWRSVLALTVRLSEGPGHRGDDEGLLVPRARDFGSLQGAMFTNFRLFANGGQIS
jgi:hypothetical protein